MAKFTAIQKIEAVQRYLNGTKGYRSFALKLGIDPKTFHYWIKCFEYHGEKAFIKSYTNYSAQFKLNVLHYMNDQGTSVRETAAIFNLSTPSLLLFWKKEMALHGLDALETKKKRCPSMKKDNQKQSKNLVPTEGAVEALQAELEQLRMENAYLKKLNALLQKKEKSPNKTKRK